MALVLHIVTICRVQAKRSMTSPPLSLSRYVEASNSIALVIFSRSVPGARLETVLS